MSQTVVIKKLKDGSGRACIHWFERMPLARQCTCKQAVRMALGCVCGANDGKVTPEQEQAYPATLPAPSGEVKARGRDMKLTGTGFADGIVLNGVRGRIACNRRQNSVTPHQQGADLLICCHTDDVRGVTCPDCMATPEYLAMAEEIESLMEVSQ